MAHDGDNKEYASKGVAGAGLGLGIAGTALALMKGDWANLFGGNGGNMFGGGYGGGLGARAQVGYDFVIAEKVSKLEADSAALKVAQVKDAEIAALRDQNTQLNLLRYIDDKTCGMMKGMPYLNPNQLADPYMGQRQVITTHAPVVETVRHHEPCGPGPNTPIWW